MKQNECMILLVKRELMAQAYDYDEVIRHEQGHCNGWRHDIVTAEKPAWPRVIDKVADNRTEDAKTQKPSVEKKPRVAAKPAEKRTAERQVRQPMPSGRESINWPLAVVSTVIWTPLYALAAFAGRGAR